MDQHAAGNRFQNNAVAQRNFWNLHQLFIRAAFYICKLVRDVSPTSPNPDPELNDRGARLAIAGLLLVFTATASSCVAVFRHVSDIFTIGRVLIIGSAISAVLSFLERTFRAALFAASALSLVTAMMIFTLPVEIGGYGFGGLGILPFMIMTVLICAMIGIPMAIIGLAIARGAA
jgi:hypothetical protein